MQCPWCCSRYPVGFGYIQRSVRGKAVGNATTEVPWSGGEARHTEQARTCRTGRRALLGRRCSWGAVSTEVASARHGNNADRTSGSLRRELCLDSELAGVVGGASWRAESVTACIEAAYRLTSGASFPPRLIAWLAGVDERARCVWKTVGLRRAKWWMEEALAGRRWRMSMLRRAPRLRCHVTLLKQGAASITRGQTW